MEFFRVDGCNGKHWNLVVKVVKLTGDFSVGINGDTRIFSEFEDDPKSKTELRESDYWEYCPTTG